MVWLHTEALIENQVLVNCIAHRIIVHTCTWKMATRTELGRGWATRADVAHQWRVFGGSARASAEGHATQKSVHPKPPWLPKTTPTLSFLACLLTLPSPLPSSSSYSIFKPPPFSIFPLSLPHNWYSPCGNANGSELASPLLSSFHPTPACSIVYMGFKLICKRQTGGRLKQRQTEGRSPKKSENPAWI